MCNICVLSFLAALFSICECLHKPVFPYDVGKFRRDLKRKLDPPGKFGDGTEFDQHSFKSSANYQAKSGFYNEPIEKSLAVLKASPFKNEQSGIRKVLQDYFDKIGRRPALDRLQLAWQPNEVARLSVPSNTALRENLRKTNVNIKKPLSSIMNYREGQISESDRPPQPNSLKADSLNILAKTIFGRPLFSNYSKLLNYNYPLKTSLKVNHESDFPGNLEALINKNISETLSLAKPEILPSLSFLTILGNKNISNPFQQMISTNEKNKGIIGDKAPGGLIVTHENVFQSKPNVDESNEGYQSKIGSLRMNEIESIKSARRLFDVLQSQNPLDLLNIPVLMNSFALCSNNHNSKASDKLNKQPMSSIVLNGNDVLQSNSLSDATTQKCIFPLDLESGDTHVASSVPSSFSNHTSEKSNVPWDPLSSILSQGMGNLSLVFIPFSRIRFDSLIPNAERSLSNIHTNKSEIKMFSPFSDEMQKINQIQNIFTKHFNDLNLKDFMDLRPLKAGNAKEDTLNLFSNPALKKSDELDFQKRVEDFFKVARLNSSDLPQVDPRILQCKPENVDARTKDLINIFNSSHLILDPKKSNFHGQTQNLLPLLKVTANMALSKYCNSPALEEKKSKSINSMTNSSSLQGIETQSFSKSQVIGSFNLIDSTKNITKTLNTSSAGSILEHLNMELKSENPTSLPEMTLASRTQVTSKLEPINHTEEPILLSKNFTNLKLNSSEHLLEASVENPLTQKSNNVSSYLMKLDPLNNGIRLPIETHIEKEVVTDQIVETTGNKNVNENHPSKVELVGGSHPQMYLLNNTYNKDLTNTTTEMIIVEFSSSKNDNSSSDSEGSDHLKVLNLKDSVYNLRSIDQLKDALSAMLTEESHDQAIRQNSYDISQIDPSQKMSQPTQVPEMGDSLSYSLSDIQPYINSMALTNANSVKPVSSIISSFNGTKYSLSNMTRKNAELLSGPDKSSETQSINFNPSIQFTQDVNSTSKLKILNSTMPENVVASKSKKKENAVWESEGSRNDHAHFYISNKTHKSVEESLGKDTKSEASCRIPSVLLDILNRMESIVNGTAGYNMFIVPPNYYKMEHSDSGEVSLMSGKVTNSSSDKKEMLERISVEPKILMTTEVYDSHKSGNVFHVITTDFPDTSKTDNIYQIMTIRNDSVLKNLSNRELKLLISTPSPTLLNQDIDEKTEGYKLTNPDLLFLQQYSHIPEHRPLIFFAIDPLKAYDPANTCQQGHVKEPVGVFIKAASFMNNVEPSTGLKSSMTRIGEPEPFCYPLTVELKCTTPCTIETKYKPVTVFPIYPMYPVYPLKPIIVGNITSKYKQDSESQR